MFEHDTESSNPTIEQGNRPFDDIMRARISRRGAITGGAAAAALAFGAASAVGGGAAAAMGAGAPASRKARPNLIRFESTPLQDGPMPTIADGYEFAPLIPWLEKLDGSGTSYSRDGLSAEQAANSIGIGHDGMWYFGNNKGGMLCINHEFGRNTHVLGKDAPESLEEVRIQQHSHGVSVVKISGSRSGWRMRRSNKNRRIHVNTPVMFSGPAAASPMLQNPAGNAPQGTVNNCANGYTPWGTYLTCEENFNGYFGANSEFEPTEMQARYGFTDSGFGYAWHQFDPRFDLTNPDYVNEHHRFGWVVEIDPNNPGAAPVKRTALGRVKHEGAALTIGNGNRAVVYMGDDQRFDYIYKFVSAGNYRQMLNQGMSPLDEGTLYVAKFNEDGTGQWLELSPNNPLLADWTIDAILVYARAAADVVGATPMDRPEWTSVARDGSVYCTLTNNSRREEPNEANPLAPNPDGHIIRWMDADGHTGTTFEWDFFAISHDVQDENGQMYGSPDGIWADADGRVFVQTDGSQPGGNNDQMLVADPDTGEFRRLFTGVAGCEVTGIATTPNRRVVFCNLQHPGNGNPEQTNWPEEYSGAEGPVPRDSTVVIWRTDGGVVGT